MISRDVLTKYDEIVASLNSDIGKQIICYYPSGIASVSTGVAQMYGINHFDADGNSLSSYDYTGSEGYAAGSTRVVYNTGVIYCRAYVETNAFRLASYGIPDPTNVWQINCQIDDIPLLTQAEYIEIETRQRPNARVRAVMVKAPATYGISQNSCYGFWRAE